MPNHLEPNAFYIGEVTDTTDPSQSMTFRAVIEGEGNQEKDIYLTDAGGSGPLSRTQLTPYPELGSKILIARAAGKWFY